MIAANGTNTLLILTGLSLLLSACMPELKSDVPPERVYWLETTDLTEPPEMRLALDVVPGLNTDRILILEPDSRLNVYAGAFWAGNLESLLESLMQRSLSAGRSGPSVRVLIERFFARTGTPGGAPDVEVQALIEVGQSRCPFRSVREAGSARLQDIVAAHQARLDELTLAVAEMVRADTCL